MPTSVTVSAPSRLHFGLWSLSGDGAFGGVGMMLRSPGVRLRLSPAERLTVAGPMADRVEQAARQFLRDGMGGDDAPCLVEVLEAPAEHSGLGLGTQLSLSVAAGLDAWLRGRARPASELAPLVGRGKRSAIGAHGFEHGGLIVDGGHSGGTGLGRLHRHVAVPESWRVVLLPPPAPPGVSGDDEAAAFESLPPVPPAVSSDLKRLATDTIAPAAAAADFDAFAEAVGQYGELAGRCFAPAQGGTFASEAITRVVSHATDRGYAGAGQSSWGPTVFAFARDSEHATRLVETATAEEGLLAGPPRITSPATAGATITVE
ncbi:MAG: beta-RFAP synthase [Planctomycetota bacterium]